MENELRRRVPASLAAGPQAHCLSASARVYADRFHTTREDFRSAAHVAQQMKFVMVGGFLGAGKTTTLSRLARRLHGPGMKVGLVTNDQAQDLVDTNSLRAQGFAVEEVPAPASAASSTTCIDKVGKLDSDRAARRHPRRAGRQLHRPGRHGRAAAQGPVRHALRGRPYAVLFKPSHGLQDPAQRAGGGFSPKAAYIFRKQLEEADAIVINRIDELTPAELEELTGLARRSSIPARRCCACRRRRARASTA